MAGELSPPILRKTRRRLFHCAAVGRNGRSLRKFVVDFRNGYVPFAGDLCETLGSAAYVHRGGGRMESFATPRIHGKKRPTSRLNARRASTPTSFSDGLAKDDGRGRW